MKGIHFVIDDTGKKRAVLIDLSEWGELWEDIYDFKQNRHGHYYEQKRVEVFYTMERDVIVTVTAYVFYGKWEGEDAGPL